MKLSYSSILKKNLLLYLFYSFCKCTLKIFFFKYRERKILLCCWMMRCYFGFCSCFLFHVNYKMKYMFMQNSPVQSYVPITWAHELERVSNVLSWRKGLKLDLSISCLKLGSWNAWIFIYLLCPCLQILLETNPLKSLKCSKWGGEMKPAERVKERKRIFKNLRWLQHSEQDFIRYL